MTASIEILPTGSNHWGLTETHRHATVRRARQMVVHTARILLVALIAGLTLGGVASAMAGQAHAGIIDTITCAIVSTDQPAQRPGSGPEDWLSNRNLAEVKEPGQATASAWMADIRAFPSGPGGSLDEFSLYEVAGLRGLSWWVMTEDQEADEDCSLSDYLWTSIANFLFSINTNLLQIFIALKEIASASNPLSFLYDAASGAIGGLFTGFFIPVAAIMLIGAGIWVSIKSVKQGNGLRAAAGGLLAAVMIMVVGGAIYGGGSRGFAQIAKFVDESIASIKSLAANTLFEASNTDPNGLCKVPNVGEFTEARGQRLTSCAIADTLAYRPWAVGTFGSAGRGEIKFSDDVRFHYPDEGFPESAGFGVPSTGAIPCYVRYGDCKEARSYLIAQAGGPVEIGPYNIGDLAARCAGASTSSFFIASETEVNKACVPVWAVWEAIRTKKAGGDDTREAYRGKGAISRVTQSFTALIGTLVVGIAVGVVAVITMLWHAMTFGLFLAGPFKLAFATYPGKAGMAKEWAGDTAHSWMAQLAYSLVLIIVILVVVWMFSVPLPAGLRIAWLAVILVVFWKLVGRVQELVRPGASALNVDVAGGAQGALFQAGRGAGAGVAGVGRAGRGAGRGVTEVIRRKRAVLADPTKSKARKAAAILSTPLSAAAGAVSGAASGALNTNKYRYSGVFPSRRGTPPVPRGSRKRGTWFRGRTKTRVRRKTGKP